jgi:phosphoribosylanthranilate isomerase
MLIKVCGITSIEQAREISPHVDYIGYIFHSNSPRNVQQSFPSLNAKKVGVFVDRPIGTVIQTAIVERLESVQLHGQESPEYCSYLKEQVTVIKAFGVDHLFDFKQVIPYEGNVDYFLFDTKTAQHGGSGEQFDWNLLEQYKGTTPFFLSGGLKPESLSAIKNLKQEQCVGVDLNSGFETAPGIKNISLLKSFIHAIES